MIGFLIASLGMLIMFLFQCFIEHIYIQLKIMNHRLDNVVLTADDFTATIDIPEKLWKLHKRLHDERSDGHKTKSNLQAFTSLLIDSFEQNLRDLNQDDLGQSEFTGRNRMTHKKMSNPILHYIFGNGVLLNMLEKRADYLKAGEFKMVEQIQKEMTDYKNANFNELMRPKKALIIF